MYNMVSPLFFAMRVKVVALLTLVGIVMIVLGGTFILRVYNDELGDRIRARAESFSEIVTLAARSAKSPADLDGLLKMIVATTRVDSVAVIDGNDHVIVSSKPEWMGLDGARLTHAATGPSLAAQPTRIARVSSADSNYADFLVPLALPFERGDGEAAKGALYLRLDVVGFESSKARAWSILVWLAGAMVIAILMISLLMQRLVVAPIEALSSYAERRGGALEHAQTVLTDEVAVIARALEGAFTAARATEARLADLAHTDGLTGLGNWAFFKARLTEELAHAGHSGRMVGVMILNLDNFKDVNDTLGHDSGDAILRRTAEIMRNCQRKSDSIARLGADEFGVVMSDISSSDEAVEYANRFIRAVGAPFRIGVHELHQTACVGLTLHPQDGRDPDVLLKNADLALSRAKLEGSGACVLYRHELHLRAMERNSIERDLRGALSQKQFVLYYQPKIEIATGRVSGAEALIRWQHPERGLIPPDLFIPIAERCGFISEVTKWVLDEACRQNHAWQEAGLPKVGVAINVSAVDLRRPDLTDMVANKLVRHGLSPKYLEIEVTESMVMRDVDMVIGTLRRLRSLGIGIGIDDFGTGYSSLAYLKRFPVKQLKIDRGFIRDIAETEEGRIIPKVIIDLAHSLGLNVLAEGVEDVEQLDILRSLGCDEAQGYYLGRPMPAAEFETFLRDVENGLHPEFQPPRRKSVEAGASPIQIGSRPGSAA